MANNQAQGQSRRAALRLSYSKTTCCWQRKKTFAVFTFPRRGWHAPPSGVLVNACTESTSVWLDSLARLDACTPIAVRCLLGGAEVLRVSVLLGDLLAALSLGPRGGWASGLDLTLRPVGLRDGEQAKSDLLLAPNEGVLPSTCGSPYALYFNGRYCGDSSDAQARFQLREVQRKRATVVIVPLPRRLSALETYYMRPIVHAVEEIQQFREIFPDIYVKASMKDRPGKWCRTDVHLKAVNARALFGYRLVMAPFSYPLRPVSVRLRRNLPRLFPSLEIAVMDQDRITRDDKLGGITFNLENLLLPNDDGPSCSVSSLGNKRVNLFDAAAAHSVRRRDAVLPREVAGYWPLLKEKMRGRVKVTGSVRLTIQLLTAREAAQCPAAQGNKAWALNRFPTLTRPKREYGKVREKLILEPLKFVESVIARFTRVPALPAFVHIGLFASFLFTKVKKTAH